MFHHKEYKVNMCPFHENGNCKYEDNQDLCFECHHDYEKRDPSKLPYV